MSRAGDDSPVVDAGTGGDPVPVSTAPVEDARRDVPPAVPDPQRLQSLSRRLGDAVPRALREALDALRATAPPTPTAGADPLAISHAENLAAVVAEAVAALPETAEAASPKGGLPLAWSGRFVAGARDAASAAERGLWGRVLAREIMAPQSVGLRALAVLPDLGPAGIALLERIARLRIGNFVVRLEETELAARGLSLDDAMALEEMGLLRGYRDLTKTFDSQREDRFVTHLILGDAVVRITHDDPETRLVLPSLRLTGAGEQLARLLPRRGDVAYLVSVMRLVAERGFHVEHATIVAFAGENGVARHTPFCEFFLLDRSRRGRPARR